MAQSCDSPCNIKQEKEEVNTEPSAPTKQNISPYVLNKDKAYKKINDAANREKHIEFKFYPSCLVIDLSAAAYGMMCKALKMFYENSTYQVVSKETQDQNGFTTEWKLSVKDPDKKKQCLGISMYHTTSRILVNGSMYPTIFLSQHLDQINQSLPDSDEMINVNQEIKLHCAEGLKHMKNQRKSESKKTPQKESEPLETPTKVFKCDSSDVPLQETLIKEILNTASGDNKSNHHPMTNLFQTSNTCIYMQASSETAVFSSGNENIEPPPQQADVLTPNKSTVATNTSPEKTAAKKVSPSCERGSLLKKDEETIQKNYTFLLQELDPSIIADHLYEQFVIDLETHDKITSIKDGKIAGMRYVIKALRNSGKASFSKFVDILRRTGYAHVADELTTDV